MPSTFYKFCETILIRDGTSSNFLWWSEDLVYGIFHSKDHIFAFRQDRQKTIKYFIKQTVSRNINYSRKLTYSKLHRISDSHPMNCTSISPRKTDKEQQSSHKREKRSRIEEENRRKRLKGVLYETRKAHRVRRKAVKMLVRQWTCVRTGVTLYTLTYSLCTITYSTCLYTMTCINVGERNFDANVIEYSEGLCVERGQEGGQRQRKRSTHTSNRGTWEIDYAIEGTRSWHAVTFDVIHCYECTDSLYITPPLTDLVMSNYLARRGS